METSDGLGSIPGRGVGFLVGWTNSGHAMRVISRTGTEGLPVSSLNCDRYRRVRESGLTIIELELELGGFRDLALAVSVMPSSAFCEAQL